MTPGTPRQFHLDIVAWCNKVNADIRATYIETIQDINEQIVVRSPGPPGKNGKATGFLRGSWHAALNHVPTGRGARGVNPTSRLNFVAAQIQIGDVYYLGNTAKYARRLEYGFVGTDSLGRTFNQAGRFWVQGVMNQATAIAREAAIRVGAKQAGGEHKGGGGVLPDQGFVAP